MAGSDISRRKTSRKPWRSWLKTALAIAIAVVVVVGVVLAIYFSHPGFYVWLGSWFIPWAQTPGFGGAAAVVAAIIAFAAARAQAAQQRRADRKEQWWKRAEWALNTTLSNDPDIRTVGFQMLASLATSEYAAEHEGDVIAAATVQSIDEALLSDETSAPTSIVSKDEPGKNDKHGREERP